MLVFSHERPLQLAAFLESFRIHCGSNPDIAIYTANCKELDTGQFKQDVLGQLGGYDYVLFCVDDTVFVHPFNLERPISLLKSNNDAIGFSLRLGLNTHYCYMKDCEQAIPKFEVVGGAWIKYNWTKAEQDFGYPLEISSSLYRTEDIIPILENCCFDSPNTLEMMLYRSRFRPQKESLLCYSRSVAVSVPFNKVQTDFPNNRSMKYTPHYFKVLHDQGKRIDVKKYTGIVPNAVHQELQLILKGE